MASSAGAPTAAVTAESPASPGVARAAPSGSRRVARRHSAPLTEKEGAKLFRERLAARDAYIAVVLDRNQETIARFFATTPPIRSLRRTGERFLN